MQSRRDQVQAHLFVMSRLAAGMLRGEPDAPDTPISRTSRGTAGGVMVAGLLCLVIAIFGFISPGGATSWQKAGTLIVVKETGARFLYLASELHPVLNETSAKLIAGPQMTLDQVSESSLAGTPRGAALGIVGAPDALPGVGEMVTGPWLSCAFQQESGTGTAMVSQLSLAIAPSSEGTALTETQGVVVTAPDGVAYLVWHGERMRLDSATSARQALGYTGTPLVPVTQSLIDALPAGPDLGAPDVTGRGSPGPRLAGQTTRVGQLFTAPGGGLYLLSKGGLVPLTTTMFDLLRGDPRTQRDAYAAGIVAPAPIGPADLATYAMQNATVLGSMGNLPAQPPTLSSPQPGQALCVDTQLSTTGAPARILTIVDQTVVSGQPPAIEPGVSPSCGTVAQFSMGPGDGVLARAISGGGIGGTEYLVSDGGVKYPIASASATKQLGYDTLAPAEVPQSLLDLLPTGPSLDPAALAASGGVVDSPPVQSACAPQLGAEGTGSAAPR